MDHKFYVVKSRIGDLVEWRGMNLGFLTDRENLEDFCRTNDFDDKIEEMIKAAASLRAYRDKLSEMNRN
jgi:hypothetical protein